MKKLLLLHGAIGSKEQLNDLKKILQTEYDVYDLNFSGHGGNSLPDKPFSIKLFALDVLNFLEDNKIEQVNIFGYSMGGYVALYFAKHYPKYVNKIATLATKFDWNEAGSIKEAQHLNPQTIEEKIPAFAALLKQRHDPTDWKIVMDKTVEMILQMGNKIVLSAKDFDCITNKVLLLVGDKDKMVSTTETLATHNHIRNSSYTILHDTPHPIEKVNMELLAKLLRDFFNEK